MIREIVMEDLQMILIGNGEFPTLKITAARQLVQILDRSAPTQWTALALRHLHKTEQLHELQLAHDKLVLRLQRRLNRALEGIHELEYVIQKLQSIALKLKVTVDNKNLDRILHYAQSELTTLRNVIFS